MSKISNQVGGCILDILINFSSLNAIIANKINDSTRVIHYLAKYSKFNG